MDLFRSLLGKTSSINTKVAAIAAIPAIAFVATIGFSMANGSEPESRTTAQVAVSTQTLPPPAAAPTVAPSPTSTDRNNCDQIRGTDYRSDSERAWFVANCSGGTTASTSGAGSTGGTSAATTANRTGTEVGTGDRLVINKIGVNAPVSRMSVGGDGVMPDPSGYFNAVLYDFPAHPGLGGSFTSGNAVLAGHVDCGRCNNGGPGLAVFYYVRNLVPGDVIEYYSASGGYQRYVVTFAGDYSPNSDWSSIVASGAADLTIITCTGTFSGGHYDLRRVVQARKA